MAVTTISPIESKLGRSVEGEKVIKHIKSDPKITDKKNKIEKIYVFMQSLSPIGVLPAYKRVLLLEQGEKLGRLISDSVISGRTAVFLNTQPGNQQPVFLSPMEDNSAYIYFTEIAEKHHPQPFICEDVMKSAMQNYAPKPRR